MLDACCESFNVKQMIRGNIFRVLLAYLRDITAVEAYKYASRPDCSSNASLLLRTFIIHHRHKSSNVPAGTSLHLQQT